MSNLKGRQGRLVVFLCSIIIVFEILTIVFYYNFLEKQLFNERKALFTQFVEKVTENLDSKIKIFWNNTDTVERLIDSKKIENSESLINMLHEAQYITGTDMGILMAFNEDGHYYTSDENEGRIYDLLLRKYAKNNDKHKVFIINLPHRKKCETYFLMVNRLDNKLTINDNEEITHVAMAVNVDELEDLFSTKGFKDRCYTYLTDNNGRIVYRNTCNNEFLDGYNIITSINTSAKIIRKCKKETMENSLKNADKMACEIKYKDDRWFVAINDVKTADCNIVLFVPSKLISSDTAFISEGTTYYFIAIIGSFIMLVFTIFMFVRINAKKDRMMLVQQKQVNELLEKQARSAEEANKAKSRFLSYMSHDIRTPMNGIMGMTDIATKNIEKKDKVKDCLNKIADSSKHLLSLLNDILDLSRIESGKVSIENKPLNIKSVVDNCATIMEGQIITRQLDLIREFAQMKYPNVIGDELHLRQILINILGNAVKFTSDGGKVIFRVKEENVSEEKVDYLFEIEDTGIGMSEDFLEHIWDAFAQAETGEMKCRGTGLGMAITKQFVDMMEGNIQVVSKLNEGSKFSVRLSFVIDKDYKATEEIEIEQVDISNMDILLVEDNELNREIALDILIENGAKVKAVENGKEAVDEFKESKPGTYDAIIMDVMMPVMDGITATKTIRGLEHKDAKTVPIIAMTANAFEEDIRRTKEAGMNAHISKPLDPDALFIELTQIKRKNMKGR